MPLVPLNKSKFSGPANLIRKEKRQGSSSFNISKNRELAKLPFIKGKSLDMIIEFVGEASEIYGNVSRFIRARLKYREVYRKRIIRLHAWNYDLA